MSLHQDISSHTTRKGSTLTLVKGARCSERCELHWDLCLVSVFPDDTVRSIVSREGQHIPLFFQKSTSSYYGSELFPTNSSHGLPKGTLGRHSWSNHSFKDTWVENYQAVGIEPYNTAEDNLNPSHSVL